MQKIWENRQIGCFAPLLERRFHRNFQKLEKILKLTFCIDSCCRHQPLHQKVPVSPITKEVHPAAHLGRIVNDTKCTSTVISCRFANPIKICFDN